MWICADKGKAAVVVGGGDHCEARWRDDSLKKPPQHFRTKTQADKKTHTGIKSSSQLDCSPHKHATLPWHTRFSSLLALLTENFLSSFKKEGRSKPTMTAQHEVSTSSVYFSEKALIQTVATWNWRLACEGLSDMVCGPNHLMICFLLCFVLFLNQPL